MNDTTGVVSDPEVTEPAGETFILPKTPDNPNRKSGRLIASPTSLPYEDLDATLTCRRGSEAAVLTSLLQWEKGDRSAVDEVLQSARNEKVAKEVAYSSSASLRSAPSPAGEGKGETAPA